MLVLLPTSSPAATRLQPGNYHVPVATNYGNEVIVNSCLAAAQVAGQLASRTGGVWTVNKACTTYVVARSTHPSDLRKDARYLTIRVVK